MKTKGLSSESRRFLVAVERSIQQAARRARATARMYGTPIYVWEKGRIVAKKP
jgi:hypothetical protein